MITQPSSSTPPPEWSRIGQDVCCPLCDYSLRHLSEPRCPECGYRFTWSEILDPNRRLHPYLFEHHPERNAWSFRRTLLGTLQPRRFWGNLLPAQPSFPRRLIAYWLLTTMVWMVFVLAAGVWSGIRDISGMVFTPGSRAQQAASIRANPSYLASVMQTYGSVDAYLNQYYPARLTARMVLTNIGWRLRNSGPVYAVLAWPWLTFAALMISQVSMRRVRIKPIHVLRCIIYSASLLAFAVPIAVGLAVADGFVQPYGTAPYAVFRFYAAALQTLLALVMIYQLIIAYRKYLRFDHAVATVLTSQFIVGLAVLTTVSVLRYGV